MAKFNPPDNFDFCTPSKWPEWRERFMRYRSATKLNKEDGDVQVSTLIYAMGKEADKIFASFTFTPGDNGRDMRNDFDTVLHKFNEHFIPKRNILHERARFYGRHQNVGETVEQFVRALHDLASTCDFKDNEEEAVRDRLVIGLLDKEVSQKLQLEDLDTLTLKSAVDTARHYELVKQQQQDRPTSVNAVDHHQRSSSRGQQLPHQRGGRGRTNNGRTNNAQASAQASNKCGNCGYIHDHRKCPARGKRCQKCNKFNHFAIVCRSSAKLINAVDAPKNESLHMNSAVEEFYMGVLYQQQTMSPEPPWHVALELSGRQINFKIDTGADVSVISRAEFANITPKPNLIKSQAVLRGPGGLILHDGEFKTTVHHRDRQCNVRCFVVDQAENLLSRDAAIRLQLIQRLDSIETPLHDPLYGDLDIHPVKCPPVHITLTDKHTPYSVATARRVPIPLMQKVKEELDRLKSVGIIMPIEEPTDWCAPIVPVLKKGGGVRICTDYKHLNKAVKRERYQLPTLEDILHRLNGAKVFSKLDATSGFFQIPLDDESCKLTTFITPFGRFYYRRLPQGITSAPEIFQRTVETILNDKNIICYFDDILVFSDNNADHAVHLKNAKDKLRNAGFKLNSQKCEYHKSEIDFLGYQISANGISIDPGKTKAISEMKPPEDITELRRFIGMVNFLGRHLSNLSTVMQPLTKLLEKETAWTWGPQQAQAFQKIKDMITSAPTLAFYSPEKPTIVSSDASSYGIGGVLLQQQENDSWRPVAYCSRTLSATERHYAQIEKECLAAVWSCERFDRYLVGLPSFILETDHKPLIPLINTRDLSETPLRCQRMLMRLARFNIQAQFVQGKDMFVADTLSRKPITECNTTNSIQTEVIEHVNFVTSSWPASDVYLSKIKQATGEDECLSIVMDYTLHGWPDYKENVKLGARHLYHIRAELSVCDGLLLRGNRIVIPPSLQKDVLERIHHGHLGITKCRERAASSVWWPGISKDISDVVSACSFCQEKQSSQRKEPLLTTPLPDHPFQQVAIDLCEYRGQQYLVLVDYYSRYIEICHMPRTTSDVVIAKLKNIFSHHGIPETVISDNGPQFKSSEFQHFMEEWNFNHVTTSPHYPQANGAAERAVRTAKHILSQNDIFKALLIYRATVIPELGASPAELAFGRKIRTNLPVLPKNLLPNTISKSLLMKNNSVFKSRQKQNFDRRHGVKQLPTLHPGDAVLIKLDGQKEWKQPAEVVKQCATRSYLLRTPEGGQLRRNRRHIQQIRGYTTPILPSSLIITPKHTTTVPATSPPPEVPPMSQSTLPVNDHPTVANDPIISQPAEQDAQPHGIYTRSGRLITKPARFRD